MTTPLEERLMATIEKGSGSGDDTQAKAPMIGGVSAERGAGAPVGAQLDAGFGYQGARPIVPINQPGLFDPSVTPAQAVPGEPPWPTSAGPSAPKRRSLVRALAPSLNVRPLRGMVWGLFLAIAVLSAMSLPMGSTAHAADRISVGSVYLPPPCPLTLCLGQNSDGSLTASSLWDIGPTPYYISVFNETTGARLAICGTGTSCTTSPYIGPPLNECYTYAAFIGGSSASIPPSPVQRSSAKRTRCNYLR